MKTRGLRFVSHNTFGLAVAAALCGTAGLDASAASPIASGATAPFVTVARPTELHQGDMVTGALPMTVPIHVEVALKLRNKDTLDAFIATNASNQAQRLPAQLMTSAQVLANHAPTQAQAQAVADYLTAAGFTHVTIAPNRLLVSADGTARTARDAFMTTFEQVRTHDGRIAYANRDPARIPAALADKVLAVVGLQDVHQGRAMAPRAVAGGAHTDSLQGHYPTEFPQIYGGADALAASHVPVGIVTDGDLNQALTDLKVFANNHQLAPVVYAVVNTNGTSTTVDPQQWQLVSQDVVGMAGGVKQLVFYNIPNLSNANLLADFNAIVAADYTKIIAVYAGECETDAQNDGSAAADDAIFQTAVAQGQTFAVGASDSCGFKRTTPNWPASSQYVVAVGGTILNAGQNGWLGETGWGNSSGGPSTFEPMPSWQTTLGVPGSTRGVPDVAFDGNITTGSLIVSDLNLVQAGGMDMPVALFAGAWARVLQARGTGFGFAGPILYALPATDFHDIVKTANSYQPAGPGYDYASGRGSMIIDSVIADGAGLGNKHPKANFAIALSALAAHFTDTSTDSDGTVASHSWNFGDGATSTAANPSHAYAVNGSYSVTETVFDNSGAAGSKTQTIIVGPLQLLANPGFESGPCSFNNWSVVPISSGLFVTNGTGEGNDPFVYDGVCAAGFETDSHAVSLSQDAAIAYYKTSATLSFHLNIVPNTATTTRTDAIEVQLNTAAGAPIATLATFSNLDTTGAYALYSFDLNPYIGQTVQVQFKSDPASTHKTVFFIDDVFVTEQ